MICENTRSWILGDPKHPGSPSAPKQAPMALQLPALHLYDNVFFPSVPKNKTYLFPNGRKLLVLPKEVIVVHGTVMSKKLTFDEDILCATYVFFQGLVEKGVTDQVLAICLKNSAHLYLPGGDSHVISFPFLLRSAWPFDSGLLLERDTSASGSRVQDSTSSYRFFTLVDPMGDLRVVTTSSTSVVAAHECMVHFPAEGLNKTHSICCLFNSRQRTMNIYHVKSPMRHTHLGSNVAQRKTRVASASTANQSRILEDDLHDPLQLSFHSSISQSLSINMEKKRTSTLLSGASLIARMGSDTGFVDQGALGVNLSEYGALRKDMIMTKIDSFSMKAHKLHICISGLAYENLETIVISNREQKKARVLVYKLLVGNIPLLESSLEIACHHAIPLNHSQFPGWLLLLKSEHSLQLVHPTLGIDSPPIEFSASLPPIATLTSTIQNTVALRSHTETKATFMISLVLEPQNKLVLSCLKAWRFLSGSKINESIWVLWRSALMLDPGKDEWNAYVTTLLSVIYPFGQEEEPTHTSNEITGLLANARILNQNFNLDYSFHDLLPYIVLSLHLMYEELKLDTLSKFQMNKLGTLLTQLVVWMGWLESWCSFYMVDPKSIEQSVRLLLVSLVEYPPNILEYLSALLEGKHCRFLLFSQLVEESSKVNEMMTPRTHIICNIFKALASPNVHPKGVVQMMADSDLDFSILDSFPYGVAIPLKNCLLACQADPDFEWNSAVLNLVGRRDLSAIRQPDIQYFAKPALLDSSVSEGRNALSIVSNVFTKKENYLAWDGQSEADRISITKLIFDKDRRYYDITSLLHHTRVQTATLHSNENLSEYDSTLLKRELAIRVAYRTLSIPLGRAALFYGGRIPLLTEKFPIPKFNLNTIIAPSMSNIVLSEQSLNPKIVEWGHFHNGVSSGLSISPDSRGITGSWVIFNKPTENNAQHAGFLLGLGLNGHLKKLEEWHIYNYLGPKHPLTSVGLLIGMAASLKRSMDNKLTKVLSVHAVALLPQGANDLNVPNIVQSAGLIGIGLLYLESQHRRMSEILLSQFSSCQIEDLADQESYRLCAGISLGLINLGKGDDLKGLNDTHVVDRLLNYAIAMKDSHSVFESDKSGSGAIVALGLIYLKTRDVTIASKLQIPESEQLLDYVRPDLLLIRCLSRNLILWDNVQPTQEWVNGEIPEVLRKKHCIQDIAKLDSDQISMFSILGGTCLSLGIKFASTYNLTARDTILHYLDIAMTLFATEAGTYDEKITLNSVIQLQNLLAVCVSVIMAGSGDLEVFRRLRVLHGGLGSNCCYGSNMAYSMALGILFLGGSQYGLGNSNFSIAALVISLYPVFPLQNSDTEVHMQVLRHFWALSVEPRCLVVRDVNDGKPIKVPVEITYDSGDVEKVILPVSLSNMERITSIDVKSQDFFNVSMDFVLKSQSLEKFKKSLTVYVLKKRNYTRLKATVSALLKSRSRALLESHGEVSESEDIKQLSGLNIMKGLSAFRSEVYFHEIATVIDEVDTSAMSSGLLFFSIINDELELARVSKNPTRIEEIMNLRLLFAYTDNLLNDEHHYLDHQFVEQLKHNLWEITNTKVEV